MTDNRWSVELGHGLGSLQLGITRDELLRRLHEAELEVDADDDDPTYIEGVDVDLALTLSHTEPHRLIQIAVEDERVQFGNLHVCGKPLHELASLLQIRPEETIWRTDANPENSLPAESEPQETDVLDEELLDDGTLWIAPLGLGLRFWMGNLTEVYLRLPEDSPRVGVGPLTQNQLELSKSYGAEQGSDLKPAPRGCFRSITTLIGLGIIAWIVWQGFQYQLRWNDALKVEAEVIAISPEDPDQMPTKFVVAYQDQNGNLRHTTLGLVDVYVPKAVGDKVELHFLPEAPDKPLAPGRAKDVAFVRFFPGVIGVLAAWVVLQLAAAIIRRLIPNRG